MVNRFKIEWQLTSSSFLLVIYALLAAGCSHDNSERPVVVSAAASTKDLMTALINEFDASSDNSSHARIVVNTGATSHLANQIIAGAPVDLFLAANLAWAEEMQSKGLVAESENLLGNQLVLAVPNGNGGMVTNALDLLDNKVRKIAVAGENVPAGIYARQVLTRLGLYEPLSSEGKLVFGHDVRSVLAFLERNEVDAGVVYATDVLISTEIKVVQRFEPDLHDKIVYVVMLMKQAEHHLAAKDFYEFLQSERAVRTIERFGFTRVRETALQEYR